MILGSEPERHRVLSAGGGLCTVSRRWGRAARLAHAVELVGRAHADGLALVGAFHQPAVDGYEWHRGFDARLGLFDRDRNPRPAAAVVARAAPGGHDRL